MLRTLTVLESKAANDTSAVEPTSSAVANVGLPRPVIGCGPLWEGAAPLPRQYEARLHIRYGRPPASTSGEMTDVD
jgi:hypothetical protein